MRNGIRTNRNVTRSHRRGQFDRDIPTPAEPDQVASNPLPNKRAKRLKLARNRRLATTMVTQHNVTHAEADTMFNMAYAEADASLN